VSLEMLNVKLYLEFDLAISVNVLIMHAFDAGIAFILQRNYMIYLPMCRKREVQRCSKRSRIFVIVGNNLSVHQ